MKSVYRRMILLIVLIGVSAVSVFGECNNLISQPFVTNFVLVLDRSGSMAGKPLEDAKAALSDFIVNMRDGDRASLVVFGDDVGVAQKMTQDKDALIQAVHKVAVSGLTRLYDALAKAAQVLNSQDGIKVIVFLTDGRDNKSTLNLTDIRSMNLGEGIFVYGLGLGDVDGNALAALTSATGGTYGYAKVSGGLLDLYGRVHSHYYDTAATLASAGAFTITSVPSGVQVKLDGKVVGTTPLKLDGVPVGDHEVRVEFKLGSWVCGKAESRQGYRNIITARESELPTDLVVESAPTNSAVFLDGAYVGMTSLTPSFGKDYSSQLKIKSVPKGRHTLKVVAVPDFDISPSQVMEFEFTMGDKGRYVMVKTLMGTAQFDNGELIKRQFKMPSFPGGFGSSPF